MKNDKIYLSVVLLISFFLVGCNDYKDFEISEKSVEITRAMQDSLYYYYRGNKVYIPINYSKRHLIIESSSVNSLQLSNFIATFRDNDQQGYIVDWVDNAISTLCDSKSKVIAIEYVVGDSDLVPISNKFYIKLKKETDIVLLREKAKDIGCIVEGAVDTDRTWIRLSSSKDINSLDASNYLYETGFFEDVDPGFIFNFHCCFLPSDSNYEFQWGISGQWGISIPYAWDITTGESEIVVAVVDQGVNFQHPDLEGRMYPYSYDCQTGNNVSKVYGKHGIMCAGIIAANHNDLGIAGIAPNVSLMDISSSLDLSFVSSEQLANGINKAWQNGADIINNSWGDQGGTIPQLHSALLESAISNALNLGREGKGCVVCFASGNEKVIDYPAYSHSDIIVVGAINEDGDVTDWSGKGNELDVVAPGVNIISLNSLNGVTSGDGTSFAAPHVAGVAALMLSVNSELTQKQVGQIINGTARKHVNEKLWNQVWGYGLLNAEMAVNVAAKKYTITSDTKSSDVNATAKFYIEDLPSQAKVSWGTQKNIAKVISNNNDTIQYYYDFDGKYMMDEIKAKVTAFGITADVVYPIKVFNEPRVISVERINYAPSPDRVDLKVNCTDPDAQMTWEGSGTIIDFPYIGDANFSKHPNLYKSVVFYRSGTYQMSVEAKNQYGVSKYNFLIDYYPTLNGDYIERKDTILLTNGY